MSLYLGTDISGNKILHITSGSASLSELKNSPISSTVFHSSLPYLEVQRFPCTTSIETESVYDAILGGYTNVKRLLITPDSQFITNYNDNAFFISINGIVPKYFSNPNILANTGGLLSPWKWFNSSNQPAGKPSATYNKTKFWIRDFRIILHSFGEYHQQVVDNLYEGIGSTYTVYIFIVKNMDSNDVYTSNNTTGDIKLNNSVFNVKGKDLLKYTYLSKSKLNSSDYSISSDATGSHTNGIYLVEPPSTGNFRLVSNSTSSIIYRGNYIIFDSTKPPLAIKNNTQVYTVPLLNAPNDTRYTWSYIVAAGFSIGSLFTISSIKKGYSTGDLYGDSTFDLFIFRVGLLYSSHYVTNTGYGKNVTWDLVGLSNGTIRLDVSIEPNSTLGGWLEERTLKILKFSF